MTARRRRRLFEIVSPGAAYSGRAPYTPWWMGGVDAALERVGAFGWVLLAGFAVLAPVGLPVLVVLLVQRP